MYEVIMHQSMFGALKCGLLPSRVSLHGMYVHRHNYLFTKLACYAKIIIKSNCRLSPPLLQFIFILYALLASFVRQLQLNPGPNDDAVNYSPKSKRINDVKQKASLYLPQTRQNVTM